MWVPETVGMIVGVMVELMLVSVGLMFTIVGLILVSVGLTVGITPLIGVEITASVTVIVVEIAIEDVGVPVTVKGSVAVAEIGVSSAVLSASKVSEGDKVNVKVGTDVMTCVPDTSTMTVEEIVAIGIKVGVAVLVADAVGVGVCEGMTEVGVGVAPGKTPVGIGSSVASASWVTAGTIRRNDRMIMMMIV